MPCSCGRFHIKVARRTFLRGVGAAMVSLATVPAALLPASAQRADAAQVSQYVLWLERMDTGEQVADAFSLDGRSVYNPGYYRLCEALRDNHVVPAEGDVYISITLIEILWGVQQALFAQGVRQPIVVHSGYRTPETNARTEGAATNSLHMYGRAVDFDVPGIDISDLADLCWSCPRTGGVGSYAGKTSKDRRDR
jgi:uncharacterized protein YcbK (DUF882 family)